MSIRGYGLIMLDKSIRSNAFAVAIQVELELHRNAK